MTDLAFTTTLVPAAPAGTATSIMLFCGFGLAVSLFLISSGVDLGACWL